MLFDVFSQRYERASTLVTSNLPFAEWTEVLGSERLTGALLDRLTHHVHILEMNGDSYQLETSRKKKDPGGELAAFSRPTICPLCLRPKWSPFAPPLTLPPASASPNN